MRSVLVGLAVVASLAMSLIGVFGSGSTPSVAAQCDDEWLGTPCGDPTESELRRAREAELEWADHQNSWADTNLAAEKAEALYWRQALVKLDPVTNESVGELVNTMTREVVSYPCDPNYDRAQSGGCVPADRDYDCWELRSWGIVNIPIINFSAPMAPELKGQDWMLLDDDHDGVGCEFYPAE